MQVANKHLNKGHLPYLKKDAALKFLKIDGPRGSK